MMFKNLSFATTKSLQRLVASRTLTPSRINSAPTSLRFLSTSTSAWMKEIPMGPADPILGLTEAFNKDSDSRKVSLGVGAYRDDNGKPYVLPSVLQAEQKILSDKSTNKEYAGIAGNPKFVKLSLDFAYGANSAPLLENRIAAVQTISGTGACRLAGEFFHKFKKNSKIYLPNPTWGNHIPIMKNAGLDVQKYSYYDPATRGLDFKNLLADVEAADDESVFLLHACAHNPTGVDPTAEQWKEISQAMLKKNHTVFFDCAYQGFASGDAEADAAAIRQFVDDGHLIFLSQSYAKNFGLYGERIGALSVVAADKEQAAVITSQLKILIRPMYSNPPIHGALIVSTILSDPTLRAQWYEECREMSERIKLMRTLLRDHVEQKSGKKWEHITDQIGMFCYTGLTKTQVDTMIKKHHVYLTSDGRISMAGVTSANVEYIASSMASSISE